PLALGDWTDSTHVAQKRSHNRAGRAEEARAAAPLSEPMPQMLNHSDVLPNSARSSTNARMQTGRAAERPAAECRAKRMLKEPPY
ncbi:unnamed protein product, partial [Effrenium voratum]